MTCWEGPEAREGITAFFARRAKLVQGRLIGAIWRAGGAIAAPDRVQMCHVLRRPHNRQCMSDASVFLRYDTVQKGRQIGLRAVDPAIGQR
ncbi:hypothetical protein DD563_01295 [Pelagicola sp. LXJ1103]|nr:hypothetical protein DD563_01295 [Pelagicola sp. LXJ1103]